MWAKCQLPTQLTSYMYLSIKCHRVVIKRLMCLMITLFKDGIIYFFIFFEKNTYSKIKGTFGLKKHFLFLIFNFILIDYKITKLFLIYFLF